MSESLFTPRQLPSASPAVASWRVEPFLHVEPERLFNPMTDRSLRAPDPGYAMVRAAALGESGLDEVPAGLRASGAIGPKQSSGVSR